jgi:hypothetical protein
MTHVDFIAQGWQLWVSLAFELLSRYCPSNCLEQSMHAYMHGSTIFLHQVKSSNAAMSSAVVGSEMTVAALRPGALKQICVN